MASCSSWTRSYEIPKKLIKGTSLHSTKKTGTMTYRRPTGR